MYIYIYNNYDTTAVYTTHAYYTRLLVSGNSRAFEKSNPSAVDPVTRRQEMLHARLQNALSSAVRGVRVKHISHLNRQPPLHTLCRHTDSYRRHRSFLLGGVWFRQTLHRSYTSKLSCYTYNHLRVYWRVYYYYDAIGCRPSRPGTFDSVMILYTQYTRFFLVRRKPSSRCTSLYPL